MAPVNTNNDIIVVDDNTCPDGIDRICRLVELLDRWDREAGKNEDEVQLQKKINPLRKEIHNDKRNRCGNETRDGSKVQES